MYLVDIDNHIGYKGQLAATAFVKIENLVKEVIEDLKLEGIIDNEIEHIEITKAGKYISDVNLFDNQIDIKVRQACGNKHFIMLEINRVKVLRDPEF